MLVRPIDNIDFDWRTLLGIERLYVFFSDGNGLMVVWTTKLNAITIFIMRQCTNEVVLATFNDIDNTTFSATTVIRRRTNRLYCIAIKYPTHLLFMQEKVRHIAQYNKAKTFRMG